MLAIARFNWPLFAVAGAVTIAAAWGFFRLDAPVAKVACGLAFAGSVYFFAGSLGVSHLIYDRSDLYRWKWLDRAFGANPGKDFVVCHCGFDEVSEVLAAKLGGNWSVLDHFDRERMTEASIRRARQLFPPVGGTLFAPFDRWPLADESCDGVFGLLAIHELRGEEERVAWFAEAKRCLRPGGRIVVAEHLRDVPNFLAFGPGFLHFHSRASWRRCWEGSGLRLADDFRVTPWIQIFILTP